MSSHLVLSHQISSTVESKQQLWLKWRLLCWSNKRRTYEIHERSMFSAWTKSAETTALTVASRSGSIAGSDTAFSCTVWMEMNHYSMNLKAGCTLCVRSRSFFVSITFPSFNLLWKEDSSQHIFLLAVVLNALQMCPLFCLLSSLCSRVKAQLPSETICPPFTFAAPLNWKAFLRRDNFPSGSTL